MEKKSQLKSFTIILIALFFIQASAAGQTNDAPVYTLPFTEDFSDTPTHDIPLDWTTDHPERWGVIPSNAAGGSPPELHMEWYPANTMTHQLNSPFIDASEVTALYDLTLEFKQFVGVFINFGSTYIRVLASTNGSDWDTLWEDVPMADIPAHTMYIDLNAYRGEVFQFAFGFEGATVHIDPWRIDDVMVYATPKPLYTLDLVADPPEGGVVSGAGTYIENYEANIEAVPNPGYHFLGWTDADGNIVSEEAAYTFVMPAEDVTLTASFELILYDLLVVANPPEAGIVAGSGQYTIGEEVTIATVANPGYAFENWTDADGNVLSSNTSFVFTMPPEDMTITAHFSMIIYTLELINNPAEGGTADGGGEYVVNEEVLLSATPAAGYYFINWTDTSGNELSQDQSFVYVMPPQNQTLIANFDIITYILMLEAEPGHGGTVNGMGEYEEGEAVTVSAVPAEDYALYRWTDKYGNQLSTEPEFIFYMPNIDYTLVAHFQFVQSADDITADNQISIYPNPAADHFVVEAAAEISHVIVSDLTGRTIIRQETSSSTVRMDINLEKGVYLVRVDLLDGNTAIKKVVIQ